MQCVQQSQNHHRKFDDYLQSLHTKLSLKATLKDQIGQSSRQNDYDILFSQGGDSTQFKQLFNNSFHQNQNFSEINEEDYEDDSLFNGKMGSCFHEEKMKENLPDDCYLLKAPTKQQIKQQKKQSLSYEYHYDQNDTRNKILQILKMKDRQNKLAANNTKDPHRQSVSSIKYSSKSLVLKPKVQTQKTQASSSRSSIKFAKKLKSQTSGIANRIKTESNQNPRSFNCHANQICRTDYDDLNDQRNMFCMITEEKDSLQCTFKPSLLKECLLQINNKTNINNGMQCPPRKSYQKNNIKTHKNTYQNQSHSLKTKNTQRQQKPTEIQRIGLSKKSSVHASGSTLDVAARNQLWLIQREERLTQKRKQQEEQKLKMQDFSFKPSINLYRKDQKVVASKVSEKDTIPPFFQRLSMAKRKSIGIKFKKDENNPVIKNIDYQRGDRNKQNLLSIVNNEKDSYLIQKSKNQRYQAAVKELHHKIMKMNL